MLRIEASAASLMNPPRARARSHVHLEARRLHCRTLRAAASRARRIPALSPSGNRISYSYDGAGRIQGLSLNPTNTNGVGTNTGSSINLLTAIQYQPMGALAGMPKSWVWGNAPAGTTPSVEGIDWGHEE